MEQNTNTRTADEILAYYYNSFIGTRITCKHWLSWEDKEMDEPKECIISAMEEYASQFKAAAAPVIGYSKKQMEDSHIVGYTKGRLAEEDSPSIYKDAVNYVNSIVPAAAAPQEQETFVWVKASERLPDDLSNTKKYFCRFFLLGNLVSENMATGAFIHNVKESLKPISGKEVSYMTFNEIEWLSPAPSQTAEE